MKLQGLNSVSWRVKSIEIVVFEIGIYRDKLINVEVVFKTI